MMTIASRIRKRLAIKSSEVDIELHWTISTHRPSSQGAQRLVATAAPAAEAAKLVDWVGLRWNRLSFGESWADRSERSNFGEWRTRELFSCD